LQQATAYPVAKDYSTSWKFFSKRPSRPTVYTILLLNVVTTTNSTLSLQP